MIHFRKIFVRLDDQQFYANAIIVFLKTPIRMYSDGRGYSSVSQWGYRLDIDLWIFVLILRFTGRELKK